MAEEVTTFVVYTAEEIIQCTETVEGFNALKAALKPLSKDGGDFGGGIETDILLKVIGGYFEGSDRDALLRRVQKYVDNYEYKLKREQMKSDATDSLDSEICQLYKQYIAMGLNTYNVIKVCMDIAKSRDTKSIYIRNVLCSALAYTV